jgi:SWIM zinc finger
MTPQTSPAPSTTSTHKPRVRRIGAYRYVIESKSTPGLGRQVDTLRLKCSCPASRHGKRCWHLVTALIVEDWRRRQLAEAARQDAVA